jgi:OmpA-OmpF porin, OOP family
MTHACPNLPLASTRCSRVRALAFAAALCATGAAAGELSVGVSAGADPGRVDCVASFACDHRSSHVKLYAGYEVAPAIDVQLAFFDAGRFRGGDTTPLGTEFGGTFKVSGIGVTAGYRWAFTPAWSLTARAGLASVRTRFDYANTVWGSASQTTAQPVFGLELSYAISPTVRLGVDYDATRFKVHTTHGRLQMLGLAAQFSF